MIIIDLWLSYKVQRKSRQSARAVAMYSLTISCNFIQYTKNYQFVDALRYPAIFREKQNVHRNCIEQYEFSDITRTSFFFSQSTPEAESRIAKKRKKKKSIF